MIVTTTNSIEGKQILEYKMVVFGEVITGVDFVRDFAAGMRNFFGDAPRDMRKNWYMPEIRRWMR